MRERILTEDTMRAITLFEGITNVHVKDCMEFDTRLVFIVDPGGLAKAIGRKGRNLTRMREIIKRRVQVVEWNEDAEQFIRRVFNEYGVQKVVFEERGETRHATVYVDPAKKASSIGKNGANLRISHEVISAYFEDIKSINIG